MIKKRIGPILRLIGGLPGKKTIVFESMPDFSDNTRAVFEEMMSRGIDKKYKLYWLLNDKTSVLREYPDVKYLCTDSVWGALRYHWVTIRAKALICCNTFLTEKHSGQKAFYLTHGTALKGLKDYRVPEGTSYMLVASEHVRPTMARDFHMPPEAVYALGYPRNDVLTRPGRNLKALFPGEFRKVVVWYPTFRQHKNGAKTGAANALPVLHDGDAAVKLNAVARECGVLLVAKPHFVQDISYIQKFALSNIRFIDDGFFRQHNITSYEFVGSCDALITDYSSIYFDYLLCGKPAAVIWEDIEEYRVDPGFAMDPEKYMKGSHKIYTLGDFEEFLRCVAAGEDPYREEREELNALLNYASDGKNSQRVTDFIIQKANL